MLLTLFWTFFKLGLFTFGGGYAMIAQMKEIIVEKRKWITEDELMQIITVAESTPGPIAINMATYIGYKKAKFIGSLLATLGVVLPSFIIIFTISLFLEAFMNFKYIGYAFVGINATVAFLIIKTGLSLFKKLDKKILPLFTFILVMILMFVFEIFEIKFSSIWFILIFGVIGIFFYAVFNMKKEVKE